MKILFTMIVIIMMGFSALAIPPENLVNTVVATKDGQSRTVYTGNYVLDIYQYVGGNTGDFGEIVTIANATDQVALTTRMNYQIDPQQGGTQPEPLYVARKNPQGQWTYAQHDPVAGALVYSDSLIGWHQPNPNMANVFMAIGQAGEEQMAEINAAGVNPFPEGLTGNIYPEFVFFTASDGDSTLMFEGQPLSGDVFQSLMFADSFPYPTTPGGQVVHQTVAAYIDNSTHHNVTMLPGSNRGGSYALPGIINPAAGEFIQAYRVDRTWDELLSTSMSSNDQLARDYLTEHGIDISADNRRPLIFVWLYDWVQDGNWGRGLWPHASPSLKTITLGAYSYGDITIVGVVVHEMGHVPFDFPDTYNRGQSNYWDLMNRGAYNGGGWQLPEYPTPFTALHGWQTVTTLSSAYQWGQQQVLLRVGESVMITNPRSSSLVEKYFVSCVSGSGLVPRDRNLIFWHLYPETPVCDEDT